MNRVCFLLFFLLVACPLWADNSSQPKAVQTAQEPAKPANATDSKVNGTASIQGKLPLDIQSRGTDQCGTLLSYKIKEELIASKLFSLTAAEKKKFVLQIITQPEFPDRPGISSQYSIALIYLEDAGALGYYLDQMQGQVHTESVAAEMQKILEWSYTTLKKYHYLLND